jgi:hypothetical protein
VGLRGSERQRRHPAVATAYRAAAALVVDELTLLLNLEDVLGLRRPQKRGSGGRRHRGRRDGLRRATVLAAVMAPICAPSRHCQPPDANELSGDFLPLSFGPPLLDDYGLATVMPT